jgi:hypothetical protein
MKYTLHITINELPKSLNKKLRSNRWVKNNENKRWDVLIRSIVGNRRPTTPLKSAHIFITRHSYRTLDFDGFVGSLKPVVDSLVTCGVLKDDSWDVVGPWVVDQKFRAKKDGSLLEITIEEVI